MSEVVIVGGGAIGLAIAWTLQRRGVSTLVLERDRVGHGASRAAAGMLCPVAEVRFTERHLLELGVHSLSLYPAFVEALEEASGMSVDYDTTGTLVVALDADEARSCRRLLAFQQELGLPARWLSSEACLEREPLLSPRVVGGVLAPHDHRIDNVRLVKALRRAVRQAGGRIREGAEVRAVAIEGDRARAVHTTDGRIPAQFVVLAAGAWTGRIAGLPPELADLVRPVRGQALALQMDPHEPLTRLTIRGRRAYCVPRGDGRLVVGATQEERGFEPGLTAGGIYELLRGVYELLPGAYELPLIDLWSGFRPASRDNDPVIGPTGVEGLILATGHFRAGILLTPVTAWAIAGVVVDGALPDGLEPFSPDRFAITPQGERPDEGGNDP